MPRVFLPQILWHSKDNKHCDRIYSLDFQPQAPCSDTEGSRRSKVYVLRLATGGADEFVHIWQIKIHELAPQYTSNKISFNALKCDSDEQPLTVRILARLVGHIGEVNAVRWNHGGNLLATGGEDRCIFLWERAENGHGSSLGESFGGEYDEYWSRCKHYRLSNVVNSICWCPDDRILAVSTEDGHVSLVDTWVEGSKIRYFEGHTSFAQGVSICPKNMLVASMGSDQRSVLIFTCADCSLRIWKRKGEKNWTNVLVLRTARDRPEPLKESEYNIKSPDLDDRRYGRSVFMSEELKTFFRRLDWSPDGRFLVTPAGIRFNLPSVDSATVEASKNCVEGESKGEAPLEGPEEVTGDEMCNGDVSKSETQQHETTGTAPLEASAEEGPKQTAPVVTNDAVYTLYIFHRKLIHLGLPMMTHISPTGAFVVVRFCPMDLTRLERQRINFFNTFANGNVKDVKIKPVKKIKRTSSLTSQPSIGIKDFFIQPKNQGEEATPPSLGVDVGIKREDCGDGVTVKAENEPLEESFAAGGKGEVKAAPLSQEETNCAVAVKKELDEDTQDSNIKAAEVIKGSVPEPQNCKQGDEDLNKGKERAAPPSPEDLEVKLKVGEHMDVDAVVKRIKEEPERIQEADDDHNENDNNDHNDANASETSDASNPSEDASTKESDTEQPPQQETIPVLGKRIVKKPQFYHDDIMSTENSTATRRPKVAKKPKTKKLPEEKEYDTDMEDDVLIPRFMFAVGTIEGSLCFYDTRETSGPVAVLKNLHFCTITDIAWSQDGLVCASSSSDGYVTFVIFARSDFY